MADAMYTNTELQGGIGAAASQAKEVHDGLVRLLGLTLTAGMASLSKALELGLDVEVSR